MTENILIFSAHSDDEAVAMGGTISKYSSQGKNVIIVIFSNGAGSSPWLKEGVVIEERIKEAEEVRKFLGAKETIFLGLKDGKLNEEIKKPKTKNKLKEIIKKYKPKQVFTHSSLDPHQDHRAVNRITLQVLDEIDKKKTISTFTYEVWNVINEHKPRLYIDITKQFKKKIIALKMFGSQVHFIYPLIIPVYYRAIVSGLLNGCRYAERFYKVR